MSEQQQLAHSTDLGEIWTWLDSFESAWDEEAFTDLHAFLQGQGSDDGKDLPQEVLAEILAVDMERRWKLWRSTSADNRDDTCTGLPRFPKTEDYLGAFPNLAGNDDSRLFLLQEECRIRRCWGAPPSTEEFRERAAELGVELTSVFEPSLESVTPTSTVRAAGSHSRISRFDLPASSPSLLSRLVGTGLITDEELPRLAAESREASSESLLRILGDFLTPYQVEKVRAGQVERLVIDDYTVEEELGTGGMGLVLKGRHRTMGRPVAIKVVSPEVSDDQEVMRRFRREIRTTANLRHPNIVLAYDARNVRGQLILVMEYIEGQDLYTLVKRNGPLPWQRAVEICLQVAQGLAYAHRKGVIHRDVKPANLLLEAMEDEQLSVKILDLGLASLNQSWAGRATGNLRRASQITQAGAMMGTVDFMAPEQAVDARAVDERSDIYALGCTLYYLVTGQVAYPAETQMKKILAHRSDPLPKIRDSHSDVPAELDQLFAKMAAKLQQNRFSSMEAVVGAMSELLGSASSVSQTMYEPPIELAASNSARFERMEPGNTSPETSWYARSPDAQARTDRARRKAIHRKVIFLLTLGICSAILSWRLLQILNVLPL